MISCDQDYRRVVGHLDQPVDPHVPFLDRGLVRRKVAVDHKEVNTRPDGICDKPFQTLSGVGEVVILFQMYVTQMCADEVHDERAPFPPLWLPSLQQKLVKH